MEVYSAIKKNKILLFADKWMEMEIFMLSEISQIEKDKYHMFSLICAIFWGKREHENKRRTIKDMEKEKGEIGGSYESVIEVINMIKVH
jgi:hypothetical protein